MSHRTIRIRTIVLAGLLAVAAAILTLIAVTRANGGTAAPATAKTAPVLVATHDLAVGASATQALKDGSIVVRQLPQASIQPGALADASPLAGELVVQPIYAGEQVTARRFGPSGAQGLRSDLTGDMRILSVPGDANQLLAGTLQDGDRVDVVASLKDGQDQTPYAKVVLRGLLVLKAAEATSGSADGSATPLSATLELSDAQAQSLFFVLRNGDWTFALRPTSKPSSTVPLPRTSASTLLGRS